ncbi:hypothetical protein ACFLW1_00605 [Chloroflexota bacterium]
MVKDAKEVLLLCEAYGEVGAGLYVLEEAARLERHVTICVSGNADLYRFFQEVNTGFYNNELNVVPLTLFQSEAPAQSGLKRFFTMAADICRVRSYYGRLYWEHMRGFWGAEVYFFTRYFTPNNYYYLRRLARDNQIVLMSVIDWEKDLDTSPWQNVRHLLRLVKLKLQYGWDMTYARLPHSTFEYIKEGFIQRWVGRVYALAETEKRVGKLPVEKYGAAFHSDCRVMFFDQPLVGSGRVPDAEQYRRELEAIFGVIGRYFKETEIGVKYHPADRKERSITGVGRVIEDWIPGEMLYSPSIKLYLGISSGALANVENGLVVSLLDLVTFKDAGAKLFIRENLLARSRSQVLFPQTIEELEDIVRGVKEG